MTTQRLRVLRKDDATTSVPPHDDKAEAAVLCCMMVGADLVRDVLEQGISEKHFYRVKYQLVFSALMSLHARAIPVDVITLENELKQRMHLEEVGGTKTLLEIFEVVPTTSNVESYCRAVKMMYAQRCRLISLDEAQRAMRDGQFERAAELARLAARPVDQIEQHEHPLVTPISGAFCVINGCYAKREYSKLDPGVELAPVPFTNFTIEITAEEWADDGAGHVERRIKMKGQMCDGAPLREMSIAAKDWANVNTWLHETWGHRPVVTGKPEVLRQVVALQHQQVAERRFFTHTGWTTAPDGSPVYLLKDGPVAGSPDAMTALSGMSDVSVSADKFGKYDLPTEVSLEQVADAYLWIERFLECADKRATAPLIAMQFLAPLASVLNPTIALWLAGRSGCRKTSLVAASMGLWGAGWHEERMPMSWQGTAYALLEIGFQGKDLPLVFDNFVPDDRGEMARKLTTVAYCIGDGTNRDRLSSEANLKTSKPVRGLVISTGEDAPRGEGQHNRFYLVNMYDDTVKNLALEEVQEAAWQGRMAPAMKHYLGWLASRVADPTWVKKVRARYYELTKQGRRVGASHMRLPAQQAWIQIGLDLALSSHPMKRWVSDSMKEEIADAMHRSLVERNINSSDARLSTRFIGAMHYLMQSGALVGQSKTCGVPPYEPFVFGWEPSVAWDVTSEPKRKHANAKDGIWVMDEEKNGLNTWIVAVEPEKAFFAIKEVLRNACPITESMGAVRSALISDGLMLQDDKETRLRLSNGQRPRLWKIKGSAYMRLVAGEPGAETPPEAPIIRVGTES